MRQQAASRMLALKLVKSCEYAMLATCDSGQPRVRPMTPIVNDDLSFWICCGAKSRKMRQIMGNPRIELCYIDKKYNHVRFTGRASICRSLAARRELFKRVKWLANHFKTPEDPSFGLLKFKPSRAEIMKGSNDYQTVALRVRA